MTGLYGISDTGPTVNHALRFRKDSSGSRSRQWHRHYALSLSRTKKYLFKFFWTFSGPFFAVLK